MRRCDLFIHVYRSRYYLLHPWKYIKEIWQGHKWMFQRAIRGYSDYDLFSLDEYFDKLIPSALRTFIAKARNEIEDTDNRFERLQNIARSIELAAEIDNKNELWDTLLISLREEKGVAVRFAAFKELNELWRSLWW